MDAAADPAARGGAEEGWAEDRSEPLRRPHRRPDGRRVSLGGCSASFVSPDGLVVTNHHCGFGALQFNSTPQRDLITNGFLAKTRDEELPAGPGSRIFVTTNIEDVTDARHRQRSPPSCRTSIARRPSTATSSSSSKSARSRAASAAAWPRSSRARSTSASRRWRSSDVRLVYAPALGIGDFGGETDNWMWPRHTGDWSFLRAYVGKDGKPADFSKDNVPYHPTHILKVSTEGVNPGDLVIVAGYPGRTFRYRTPAEVATCRISPIRRPIKYATDLNNILASSARATRRSRSRTPAASRATTTS